MTPHTKLKVANGLMLLGTILIPVSFYRFLAMVTPATPGGLNMGLFGEGLIQLGAFIVFALVVGMFGFVWSLRVEKRHPAVHVSGTFAFRIAVFVVVFAPFVLSNF